MNKDKNKPDTPNVDDTQDIPMITYRERIVDSDGVQSEKLHIVPVAEWTEYEKEHGL